MIRRPIAVPIAAAGALAAGWLGITRPWQDDAAAALVQPDSDTVADREAQRRPADAAVLDVALTAAPATINLGERSVETWAFNGSVPGPELRINAGDVVRARVINQLPAPLTVHWHGIALRNDMDGVPDLTQQAIKPGDEFVYEFTAPEPGTYFYHPHTGTQLDRGLYAPLIVEDPDDNSTDKDFAVMIDDWIDGTGETPDAVLHRLRNADTMPGMNMDGHDMSGMDMSGPMADMPRATPADGDAGAVLGADTGDVDYPLYLINGRGTTAPSELRVQPGDRVRLRLINTASDTPFRVAVGGTALTVVATDGFPVEPVTVDNLIIGMGERYDVTLTVPAEGTFPLVAVAEGKTGQALAILRAGEGPDPTADVAPPDLTGRSLTLADLTAPEAVALPAATPDRTYRVQLTGAMANGYQWGIEAPSLDGATLAVREGDRVRLTIENSSMMWHPIHLHGHTFQVDTGNGNGPRKDTLIVPPMGSISVEFTADNPGQWALHCHNIYHAEAGMVTVVSYLQ